MTNGETSVGTIAVHAPREPVFDVFTKRLELLAAGPSQPPGRIGPRVAARHPRGTRGAPERGPFRNARC